MTDTELRTLLEKVRSGELAVESAATQFAASQGRIDFAHVDLDRHRRCGFPEVIFCEGKSCEWIEGVVRKLIEANQDCLATRVNADQSLHLARQFPQAEQDRVARTFWLPARERAAAQGKVVVITAGTSDLPVAQEAMVTAQAMGCDTSLMADVGVAGIHRLLRQTDRFRDADALVAVAGMDGALPSVVGGLADRPVIAVPTSVGYGASFGGVAALLTMLNACPANVVVVNIDAGFKAGFVAALIARNARRSSQE